VLLWRRRRTDSLFRLSQDKTAASLHLPARQALRDKPG